MQYLSDENFNGDIIRGLLRRRPDFDLARVQDMGLLEADDEVILDWAAVHNRIVLSHDQATMTGFANARMEAGLSMPGLFIIPNRMAIGKVLEDLFKVEDGSVPSEWISRVLYFPLRSRVDRIG